MARKTTKPRTSTPPRVAIVVSRYNAPITDALLRGAQSAWKHAGGRPADLTIVDAAGAFELVALAAAAAMSGLYDGILALGCIIQGETRHDEYLAHAVTRGLGELSIHTVIPVGLGVLTVNDIAQARARAGLEGDMGNKGEEAMQAVLATIKGIEALSKGRSFHIAAPRPDKVKKGRG